MESTYKDPLLGNSVDKLSQEIREDLVLLDHGMTKMSKKDRNEIMNNVRIKLDRLNEIEINTKKDSILRELSYNELSEEYKKMTVRNQPFQYQDALIYDEFNRSLLEDRNQHLKKLEGSMTSVNQLMKEAASLVDSQGYMINTVQNNTDLANNNINQGLTELNGSSNSQSTKSAILKWVFSCVAVFVAILIALAIFKFVVS